MDQDNPHRNSRGAGAGEESTRSPEPGQRDALRRGVLRGALGYVSLKTVTGALTLVAGLLLYRVLGPDDAGRLQLTLALGMSLASLCGLGYYETLARFLPERPAGERGPLVGRALRFNVLALTVATGAFLLLLVLDWGIPSEVRQVSLLFVLFVWSHALTLTVLGMLRGEGRLTMIPRLDLVANFGGKAGALGLTALAPGFVSAFAAHAVAQTLAVLAGSRSSIQGLRSGGGRFTPRETRFGILILVGMVLQTMLGTLDLFVLRILLGPREVGLVAAGYRIPLIAEQLVLVPIGVPLLYYFSRPDTSAMREAIIRRGTRVVGALLGFAALMMAVLSGPLILVLLGEAYRESIPVATIYAAHAMGIGLLLFTAPLYSSIDRPEFGIVQGGVTFVLNLGLDLVLIPRFGPPGAAMAGTIAVLATALGAAWYLHHRFGIDLRRVTASIIGLYGLAYAFVLAGLAPVAILVYVAGIFLLRLLVRDDLRLLTRAGRAS